MNRRPHPVLALPLLLVLSSLVAVGLVACPAAAAPTATADTAGASLGGTVRVSGTGWLTSNGTAGSSIAVKIDDGAVQRRPGDTVNPNPEVWAIIEVPADGAFTYDLRLPDGANSAPAFAPGAHSLRLLTGSLKSGDVPRSVLIPAFEVSGPASSTTFAVTPTSAAYGAEVQASVAVTSGGAPAGGAVVLTSGDVTLGQAPVTAGGATVTFSSVKLGVGTHTVTASFSGAGLAPSRATASVVVDRATSITRLTLSKRTAKAGQRVRAVVKVRSGLLPVGRAKITRKGKVIARARVEAQGKGRVAVLLPRLAVGRHRLVATFTGSPTVTTSVSPAQVLKVRRG